jgi:hypothetical protein
VIDGSNVDVPLARVHVLLEKHLGYIIAENLIMGHEILQTRHLADKLDSRLSVVDLPVRQSQDD